MINKGDIIKVLGEFLIVIDATNNGSYKCKDKQGRIVWTSYLQKPVVVKGA